MSSNNPIRMCIMCKTRKLQKELIRLQYKDDMIIPYLNRDRSFYLCSLCSLNNKKINGLIHRFKLSDNAKNKFINFLKELN